MQGEGDDRSLTDTLPEDSVSVTGSEMNTPNTIRKGKSKTLQTQKQNTNTKKSEMNTPNTIRKGKIQTLLVSCQLELPVE